MPRGRIVFMGGNGHCRARLGPAGAALATEALELVDVAYPGFEGRPRAPDLDRFLRAIAEGLAQHGGGKAGLAYATGIGGLIAVALRARGHLRGVPLVLQAPVLWGLERRLMPRLMRYAPVRGVATRLFASAPFQRRFVRRHFTRSPSAEMQVAFFEGYARCAAFPDLFAWFTPARLRSLERELTQDPAALRDVRVWWGGRDGVVTPREMQWTEQALGTRWPLTVFPDWGHYPMIDEPQGWAQAVARTL